MKKLILSLSCQRVYDYMKEHGEITSLDAIKHLGETRLSARIFDLKASGITIQSEWLSVTNRYHEKRRVKAYYIGKKR